MLLEQCKYGVRIASGRRILWARETVPGVARPAVSKELILIRTGPVNTYKSAQSPPAVPRFCQGNGWRGIRPVGLLVIAQ